jgi:hypothetical protein
MNALQRNDMLPDPFLAKDSLPRFSSRPSHLQEPGNSTVPKQSTKPAQLRRNRP